LAERNQELLAEIARLREDLRQLREVVNILVNVVMEEEWEEEEPEFPSYPSGEKPFPDVQPMQPEYAAHHFSGKDS